MNKILIAFTAGVVVGILYAPAKGKNTRNKIANIGNDLKQGWNDITNTIADKIDSARERFDSMADKAVDKIEGAQFGVNDII
jgi:gas vesicle protein